MEHFASFTNLIALFAVVLIVIYWIHCFVILYHLIRFGVGTRPKQASVLFFIGSVFLFILIILSVVFVIISPTPTPNLTMYGN